MRASLFPFALALVLPAVPAAAQDFVAYGGAGLSFYTGSDAGTRQDLNLYVEGEFSGAYAGLSMDIYNGSVNNVVEPYFGYRAETSGGLSYDVSYTRSIYPNDGGDCCGTFNLSLGLPVSDRLTASFETNFYPEDNLADVYLSMDIAVTDALTITPSYGIAGLSGGGSAQDWELAAAYQLGEATAVTVHYYDGSDFDPYFGLDLTWDVTLFGG